ncbi:hypothetical protein ACRRTK_013927 [Alexandromys fortis]
MVVSLRMAFVNVEGHFTPPGEPAARCFPCFLYSACCVFLKRKNPQTIFKN